MIRRIIEHLTYPPPTKGKYHSLFGGTWLDLPNATELAYQKKENNQISEAVLASLLHFIDNGFVILREAIDHKSIDHYLQELNDQKNTASKLKVSVPVVGPQDKDVLPIQEADVNQPLAKILDTYVHLPSARDLIFAKPISEFLKAVFEEDILAFQSLHFERGSTQAVHQDTAYVVLKEPMKLCASWIALEDILPSSGELIYYPGSHRLPDWVYSNRYKYYNHSRDEHQSHLDHLEALHSESQKRGLKIEHFFPKKGDVLIWAADLAHGGAPIEDDSLSRRSLVTHYTNYHNNPHYFKYLPRAARQKQHDRQSNYYSSMYY